MSDIKQTVLKAMFISITLYKQIVNVVGQ